MIRIPRPPPVCYLALFSVIYVQAQGTSIDFVTRIYDQYRTNQIPDLLGVGGDTIFTTKFLVKYRALSKLSPDRHGLGWDPLCQCDDVEFPGYAISEIKIKPIVSKLKYAKIEVLFKISGFGIRVVLDIRKVSGKWLIDDIHTVEIRSYIEFIEEELQKSQQNTGHPLDSNASNSETP